MHIIESVKPDVYGVFSYALWCDQNMLEFEESGLRNTIENLYGINFRDDLIIHTADVYKVSPAYRQLTGRQGEKFYGFLEWVLHYQHQKILSGFDEIWLIN